MHSLAKVNGLSSGRSHSPSKRYKISEASLFCKSITYSKNPQDMYTTSVCARFCHIVPPSREGGLGRPASVYHYLSGEGGAMACPTTLIREGHISATINTVSGLKTAIYKQTMTRHCSTFWIPPQFSPHPPP